MSVSQYTIFCMKEDNINNQIYGDVSALLWYNCCDQLSQRIDGEFGYSEREKVFYLVKTRTLRNISVVKDSIKSQINA